MATHDEKQKALRLLSRGEEVTRSGIPLVLVGAAIGCAGYIQGNDDILWAGIACIMASAVTQGIGELYLQAARRIMDRRNPPPPR